jgi:excinuclease ABC subunit A
MDLDYAAMPKAHVHSAIRLKGVRHNNLKNFDLDLPLGRLIVVTGLSGSGKSSLAFDTLYAEGQRRYIETFSPYARQFFDRMDKPRVDSIQGIPPAIALEQRNSIKTTRSTVGTMTELTDYMKLLWTHIARLHCRKCGKIVQKDSPQQIWNGLLEQSKGIEALITFTLPLSEKISLEESFGLLSRQGYQRVFLDDNQVVLRLDEALGELKGSKLSSIVVVQDRVRLESGNRPRFIEACEQAYHFGKGTLGIYLYPDFQLRRFSKRLHCAECDIEYRDASPALFSFNNPVGACSACKGFGRVIAIDYNLAIPDRSLSIAQGVVKPWQTGTGLQSQHDLLKACRTKKVRTDVPFEDLPRSTQDWVINGDPEYAPDEDHEWPRYWYGIKGYFRWLESKAYKMHVRVQLARYRCYTTCPECKGQRFKPDALQFRVTQDDRELNLADFYQLPVRDTLNFIKALPRSGARSVDPFNIALEEVQSRLNYLDEVGLGYLSLDRPARTLSGGETERVNLTTCLGSRLVNTLFVLDEPSVGLHARDSERLVRILKRLRDTGNTVVVVEHEPAVMRAADEIVDMGPGQGERGGHVIFQGPYSKIIKSPSSITGAYLDGRRKAFGQRSRAIKNYLKVTGASLHNVRDLSVDIPLNCFAVVTGVSGSGKSTLIRELLFPTLSRKLETSGESATRGEEDDDQESCSTAGSCRIAGWEQIGGVIMVDQSSLGRTPRSNPAVYIGAFDYLRDIFAGTDVALQRGLNSSAFSFNSGQGQCEKCHGAGFEKIEMQFLSDIFIRCGECNGRRYRSHILEITVPSTVHGEPMEWSIADLLEATVDDAIEFLSGLQRKAGNQRGPVPKAIASLKVLQEVGLGYLRLGQPINTLSGGESQRLKLVSHLAQCAEGKARDSKPLLFIFDEPTTGLHFQDTEVLLAAFQRLVDAGHSVLVVEHNLDVIRSADWIIDLGPEAGDLGGRVVAQGRPEDLQQNRESVTGTFLTTE